MDVLMKVLAAFTGVAYIWSLFFVQKYVFCEERTKKHVKILAVCSIGVWIIGVINYITGVAVAVLIMLFQSVLFRKERQFWGIFSFIAALFFWDGFSGFLYVIIMRGTKSFIPYDISVVFGSIFSIIVCIGLDYIFTKKKEAESAEASKEIKMSMKCILYTMCLLMEINYVLILGITFPLQKPVTAITSSEMFQLFYSNLIAIAVIVLLHQNAKKIFYSKQLQKMQHNMILTMADIVENRDENTGEHIRRTAEYVAIIAKTMQKQKAYPEILTDEYVADMIIAAPLHDMGKIHIPEEVLNKPGRLDEEELALMKQHTLEGERLLSKAEGNLGAMSYLKMATLMAGYHHEWWNGEGYPHGVAGDKIPLCARIMAVADVFDALLSQRCYKAAMSLDTAYGIMERETGSHFDPVVMKAFWEAKEELEKVAGE